MFFNIIVVVLCLLVVCVKSAEAVFLPGIMFPLLIIGRGSLYGIFGLIGVGMCNHDNYEDRSMYYNPPQPNSTQPPLASHPVYNPYNYNGPRRRAQYENQYNRKFSSAQMNSDLLNSNSNGGPDSTSQLTKTGTWLGPGIAGLIIGILPLVTVITSFIPAFVSIPVISTSPFSRRRRHTLDSDSSNLIHINLSKYNLKDNSLQSGSRQSRQILPTSAILLPNVGQYLSLIQILVLKLVIWTQIMRLLGQDYVGKGIKSSVPLSEQQDLDEILDYDDFEADIDLSQKKRRKRTTHMTITNTNIKEIIDNTNIGINDKFTKIIKVKERYNPFTNRFDTKAIQR